MTVRIEPIKIKFLLEHATELFEAHKDEVVSAPSLMRVKPNAESYSTLESLDAVYCLAALDGMQLIGYSVTFIFDDWHDSDRKSASNDLLYVHPDHRRGRLGLRLMQETETEARKRGAHTMLWGARPSSSLSKICERLDYPVENIIYRRRLV